jgi:uncharacterized protein YcaQ
VVVEISRQTRRRFVLGCRGLWPGRRTTGIVGTRKALRQLEAVQVDPLNVLARSHELTIHSRVHNFRSEHLDTLMYKKREFFDYGGTVRIVPMSELPYLRSSMAAVPLEKRWSGFAAGHKDLIVQVLQRLRDEGPLGARDFAGTKSTRTGFRSTKDSSRVLYYLWLTGELMTYSRRNFERIYALRSQVAPTEFDYAAPADESNAYLARKLCRQAALFTERWWSARFRADVDKRELFAGIVESGYLTQIRIDTDRSMHYIPTEWLGLLEQVDTGKVPTAWQPTGPDTRQEVVFLAPLDDLTKRTTELFDFEYLWEVYKPSGKRRWGYYTMPVLYGDELVARIDPRMERAARTLHINGLWFESDVLAHDADFNNALDAGLNRLAQFSGADRVVQPARYQ